jgi:hypothetical protein
LGAGFTIDLIINRIPMEFINESQYGIGEYSHVTKNLMNDIIYWQGTYLISLTDKINSILDFPNEFNKIIELYIESLFKVYITNDLDIICELSEQLVMHNKFNINSCMIKFIIRFCNLQVVQLLMERFDLKSKIGNYRTMLFHQFLSLIAERHDDNVEILDYVIEVAKQYIGRLNDIDTIFFSAAHHSNIKIFKTLHYYFVVEGNCEFDKEKFKPFVLKYLDFPTDIIDYLVSENYLDAKTILESLRTVLNNDPKPKECHDNLRYIFELINDGKIIFSKNDIYQLKQLAENFPNTEYSKIINQWIDTYNG